LAPGTPGSTGRYGELDSLRGIASLIVVLFHGWMTVRWSGDPLARLLQDGHSALANPEIWFKISPLRVITAGPASVGLFFTLSGFVLSLPWARGKRPTYAEFLVKRFFRLYVPFAVAIGAASVICRLSEPSAIAALSDWFNDSWREPVTTARLLEHLLMLGTRASMSLDNVMWSLVHEARISMVFPLLILATRLGPLRTLAASVALFLGISLPPVFGWLTAQLAAPGSFWEVATLLDTLRYGIYFVAGIVLATHLPPILRFLAARNPIERVGCWTAAAILLLVRVGPLSDGFWALGATLLIALALSATRAKRLLGAFPLRWLGRVSYSLYLIHVPILLGVVHAGYGRVPLAGLLALACVLALLSAEAFYRGVERPSQGLGQRFSSLVLRAPGWQRDELR
jgi:peptidoglycan/LPS O-acetylase OafA/YrhL